MIQNREQKMKVLEMLVQYTPKMICAVEAVTEELCDEKLEDTYEYLQTILTQLDWIRKAVKGTADLINENSLYLDIALLEKLSLKIKNVARDGNYAKLADIMRTELLPQLTRIQKAAYLKV